jgi:DNA uptake protein ComE-like DNA-binding protein
MDRMPKVKINTCSRWELLRLPGVGNKIADKICKMREKTFHRFPNFIKVEKFAPV